MFVGTLAILACVFKYREPAPQVEKPELPKITARTNQVVRAVKENVVSNSPPRRVENSDGSVTFNVSLKDVEFSGLPSK